MKRKPDTTNLDNELEQQARIARLLEEEDRRQNVGTWKVSTAKRMAYRDAAYRLYRRGMRVVDR